MWASTAIKTVFVVLILHNIIPVAVSNSNFSIGLTRSIYSSIEGSPIEICVIGLVGSFDPGISDARRTATLNFGGAGGPEMNITFDQDTVAGNITCVQYDGPPGIENENLNEDIRSSVSLTAESSTDLNLNMDQDTADLIFIDNEVVYISLMNSSDQVVNEGDDSLTICIELIGTNDIILRPIVFYVFTQDNSATGGMDYISVHEIVAFNAGSDDNTDPVCVNVTITDDDCAEMPEYFSFHIKLIDRNVWLQGPAYVNVSIVDDDEVWLNFTQDSYSVYENDDLVTICLALSTASMTKSPISTRVYSMDQTAIADDDYTAISTMFTFPTGSMNGTELCVNITILNDDCFENSESFTVLVDDVPTNVFAHTGSVDVTIEDEDIVDISFNQSTYSTNEGSGSVEICLVLTANDTIKANITVSINTSDSVGSLIATPAADFTLLTGQLLTFSSGAENGQISCYAVAIIDDDLYEKNEEFNITVVPIDPSQRVTSLLGLTTIIIYDNEELSIGFNETDYSVSEDEMTLNVCFTALLPSQGLGVDAWFQISTVESSAQDGDDFTPLVNATLVFLEGTNTSPAIICTSITITDNQAYEKTETFSIEFGSSDINIVFTQQSTTVEILDNDDVNLSLSRPSYSIGENVSPLQVCARLSNVMQPTQSDIWFYFLTQNSSAIPGEDYVELNNEAGVITAGAVEGTENCTNIIIINDISYEKSEQFTVSVFTNETGVSGPASPVPVMIDSDDEVDISFTSDEYSVEEGDMTVTVGVVLSAQDSIQSPIWFTLVTFDGSSAMGGEDYTPVNTNDILSFPVGSDNGTVVYFNISIIGDDCFEPNENFFVSLFTTEENVNAAGVNISTVEIEDDEEVTIAFQELSYTVREDEGYVSVCVILSDSPANTLKTTIQFSILTADNTAEDMSDFNSSADSRSLSFMPGDSTNDTACANISIIDDDAYEKTELFSLHIISTQRNVNVGILYASVIVQDDDRVNISFTRDLYTVGEEDGVATIGVLLSAPGTTESSIWFTVETSDDSAREGEDYTSFNDTLTFLGGSNPDDVIYFNVSITNDECYEESIERFNITILEAEENVYILDQSTSVNIEDDEVVQVAFAQDEYSVDEDDGIASICVVLSATGTTKRNVDFEIRYLAGSAVSPDDFEDFNGNFSFESGSVNQSMVCLNITIVDDNCFEKSEYIQVQLTADEISAFAISPSVTRVDISDNDVVEVSIVEDRYYVDEDGGYVSVCFTLSQAENDTKYPLWFNIFTTEGSATWGDDYQVVDSNLTFPSGSNEDSVICYNITINDDQCFEKDEYFRLSIGATEFNVDVGRNTTIITIRDEDVVYLSFTETDYTVNEGDDIATVCLEVAANGTTKTLIWLNLYTEDSSAIQELDYVAFNETVYVPIGSSNGSLVCVNITIVDDSSFEKENYFLVNVGDVENNVFIEDRQSLIHVIDNDVISVNFTQDGFTVTEGEDDSAMVCVVLITEGDLRSPVWYNIVTEDRSAIYPNDYSSINETLSFATGSSNGSIVCLNITIADDQIYERTEYFAVLVIVETRSLLDTEVLGTILVHILNDDLIRFEFIPEISYMVGEGVSSVLVSVNITGDSGITPYPITITLTTESGTAIAGSDFVFSSQNITFPADSGPHTSLSISVDITEDSIVEDLESFNVVAEVLGDVGMFVANPAVVTIADDDIPIIIDNTPDVNGNDVEVRFTADAVNSVQCTFPGISMDCTSGVFQFSINPRRRGRGNIRIISTLLDGRVIEIVRSVRRDNDRCDVHVINEGPVVETDSRVTIEFASTGPFANPTTTSFNCEIDDNDDFTSCSSPFTTLPLSSGEHLIIIRPTSISGCDRIVGRQVTVTVP